MKTTAPIDLDKAFASIGHGSIIDDLGSTAEAGPDPGTPLSRADRAALDAVRPAMVLWTQRITQATRAIEDVAKDPDRAAAARRVTATIDQLKDDAAFELIKTLVLRTRIEPSAIGTELGDAARAVDTFKTAVFSVDPKLDSEPVVTQMNRLAIHFGYQGWWKVPQPKPLHGPPTPEVNFARPILESAIADALQMESAMGARGSQVDQRRLEWIDTLNALASMIPQLSKEDRESLRPRVRTLVAIFERLRAKEQKLTNELGFDDQGVQMKVIEKVLQP